MQSMSKIVFLWLAFEQHPTMMPLAEHFQYCLEKKNSVHLETLQLFQDFITLDIEGGEDMISWIGIPP